MPGVERSPFLDQVEAFADSVLGGRAFPFPPEHDLATMALVLRAQAMATAGLTPAQRGGADAAE